MVPEEKKVLTFASVGLKVRRKSGANRGLVYRCMEDRRETYEPEKLSAGAGRLTGKTAKRRTSAPAFAAQLLCALQQLCAGIFIPVF